MAEFGYFRFPAIYNNFLVFVSEGDVWKYDLKGDAPAYRLTDGFSGITKPAISPDGKYLAYNSNEEGAQEIFLMPLLGGVSKRISFVGYRSEIISFSDDSRFIYFCDCSDAFTLALFNLSWRFVLD